MPKKTRKNPDLNQLAASIARLATDQTSIPIPIKNPNAVALGRLGGLKGGKARAKKLSSKKRSEIAKKAADARWHR